MSFGGGNLRGQITPIAQKTAKWKLLLVHRSLKKSADF
jgi:hypothetical protein